MTQEEIIELAIQGHASTRDAIRWAMNQEREACAKFCETHQVWVGQGKRGFSELGEEEFVTGGIHQGMDYAAAIRARKQA